MLSLDLIRGPDPFGKLIPGDPGYLTEIQFELEKYGVKDQIDKSAMTGILTLFSRFNLIEVNGKIGEKDCLVRLYPSLQFALESEEFGRFAELTRRRMLEKTGEVSGEEDADEYE